MTDRKTMHIKDAPPNMALALEAMHLQILLIAVEKLGGELVLTVDEVDNLPRGKRMDMTIDREGRVFTFKVTTK
jgi:hypothetical protein